MQHATRAGNLGAEWCLAEHMDAAAQQVHRDGRMGDGWRADQCRVEPAGAQQRMMRIEDAAAEEVGETPCSLKVDVGDGDELRSFRAKESLPIGLCDRTCADDSETGPREHDW